MIVIEDEALRQAGISEADMRLEIAILLYSKEVYSLRKSAEYAEVSWIAFGKLLKERGIETIRITAEELAAQVEVLQQTRVHL